MTELLAQPPIGNPNFLNGAHWGTGGLTSAKQKDARLASLELERRGALPAQGTR